MLEGDRKGLLHHRTHHSAPLLLDKGKLHFGTIEAALQSFMIGEGGFFVCLVLVFLRVCLWEWTFGFILSMELCVCFLKIVFFF